jgi:lipoate-protein ligase A
MHSWRFISLETFDGYWNMALDEAILQSVIEKKSPNTIRLYKWSPSTVSIGRNQSLLSEVDLDFIKNNRFNVVRRITGGGAVFHDEYREITYSIVCPLEFLEKLNAKSVMEQFEIIEMGIISGLQFYGLKPEKGIIHCPAIFLEGKKFSGNAQLRRKRHILQHGTILLELDPELMYSALKAPHNVSKSRMVRSVYSKCTGIKEHLESYNEQNFLSSLKKGFETTLQITSTANYFTEHELRLAKKFVNTKYRDEKWLRKYE